MAQAGSTQPCYGAASRKGNPPELSRIIGHMPRLYDPLAAQRTTGGVLSSMWSEQAKNQVTSGDPGERNTSAPAMLAYDIPNRIPWDWRLSLYTWTKGIAAGAYLVRHSLSSLIGSPQRVHSGNGGTRYRGLFLSVRRRSRRRPRTPRAFLLSLPMPNLAVGSCAAGSFSRSSVLFCSVHSLAGQSSRCWITDGAARLFGVPLSVLTGYTLLYLFAQATARDLWQKIPLLPPHLLCKPCRGVGGVAPGRDVGESTRGSALAWTLGLASSSIW